MWTVDHEDLRAKAEALAAPAKSGGSQPYASRFQPPSQSLQDHRSVQEVLLDSLDIAGTAEHALRGFRRVALQFPDELLHLASATLRELQTVVQSRRLLSIAEDALPSFFILADTSFDGYQVDFIAAQHIDADLIVHYGPADLEAEGPIETRFVFCSACFPLAQFLGERRFLFLISLPVACHARSADSNNTLIANSHLLRSG
eukprot:6184764-Pleurochrysis_carterae.AAC.2